MKTQTPAEQLPDTIRMKWHPQYVDRGEQGCPLCGRLLKDAEKRRYIHIADGGGVIVRADIDENDPRALHSMGWFEVGATCAKKLGLAYSKELPPLDIPQG